MGVTKSRATEPGRANYRAISFLVRFLNRGLVTGADDEGEELQLFRIRLICFELLPLIATEPCECRWDRGKIEILKSDDWRKLGDPNHAWLCLLRDIEDARLNFTMLKMSGEPKMIRTTYKRDSISGDFNFKGEQIVENEYLSKLGRNQRVVNLPCGKYIFRRKFTNLKTTEQRVYADLIESLENGNFENLRLCTICHKFFLKEHGNQKYCVKCASEAERKSNCERQVRRRTKLKLALAKKTASSQKRNEERAGRELFEGVKKSLKDANMTSREKDRLNQIRSRVTQWSDLRGNWNQLAAKAQMEWSRAAKTIL